MVVAWISNRERYGGVNDRVAATAAVQQYPQPRSSARATLSQMGGSAWTWGDVHLGRSLSLLRLEELLWLGISEAVRRAANDSVGSASPGTSPRRCARRMLASPRKVSCRVPITCIHGGRALTG